MRFNIPTSVEVKIRCAVSGLRSMKGSISQGESLDAQFLGGGRYTSDVVRNRWGTTLKFFQVRDEYLETIKRFHEQAIAKGIDSNAVLEEMGWNADLEKISLPAEVWEWM